MWIKGTARPGIRGRILDVGCGSKPYRGLFTESNQYLGLDLPPERDIPRAAQRARTTRGAVDVYGSALNLPFAPESVDAVVSFQVLEHVPEPGQALSEMARVLSPGGFVVLTAPQMWHEHEAPHDYYRYTRYGLAYLLEATHLEVTELRPVGGFMARAGLKLTYFLDRVLRRLGRIWQGFQVLGGGLMAGLNLCFAALDGLFPTPQDPINHLVLARKPGETLSGPDRT